MINLDFWYNNKVSEVDAIDICFYPNGCYYAGNMYKNNKIIGDYTTKDSLEIEKTFSHLSINWD